MLPNTSANENLCPFDGFRLTLDGTHLSIVHLRLGFAAKAELRIAMEGAPVRALHKKFADAGGRFLLSGTTFRAYPHGLRMVVPMLMLDAKRERTTSWDFGIQLTPDVEAAMAAGATPPPGPVRVVIRESLPIPDRPYSLLDWYDPLMRLFAWLVYGKKRAFSRDDVMTMGHFAMAHLGLDEELVPKLKDVFTRVAAVYDDSGMAKLCEKVRDRGYATDELKTFYAYVEQLVLPGYDTGKMIERDSVLRGLLGLR